MSTWLCRERTFWRDVTWEPGQELTVKDLPGSEKWKLGRGWWAPAGVMVVDMKDNILIPWYFEPTDMGVLVDAKEVYLARDHKLNDREWKFTFEIETEAPGIDELPAPEPLTLDTIKKLKDDPDALVTDRTRAERMRRTRKTKPS